MPRFRYLVNSKIVEYEDPLYFFEWTYEKGHVPFGMYGTEQEYDVGRKKDLREGFGKRVLRKKEPIQQEPPITKIWDIPDLEFANSIRSYEIKDECNRRIIENLLKKN